MIINKTQFALLLVKLTIKSLEQKYLTVSSRRCLEEVVDVENNRGFFRTYLLP
jgi:hypothetical protein